MTLCFFRFDLQFHVVIMPRLMVWSGAGRDCVLVDLLLSPLTQREIILMFHKSSVGGEMCPTFSGCVLATAMFPIWTVVPCCMSSPLSLSSPLKLSCHVKPWRAKKITQICHVLSPLTPRHHTLKKRRMTHTKHTCDLQKKHKSQFYTVDRADSNDTPSSFFQATTLWSNQLYESCVNMKLHGCILCLPCDLFAHMVCHIAICIANKLTLLILAWVGFSPWIKCSSNLLRKTQS